MKRPEPLSPFVLLRDAVAPLIENLRPVQKPTVSRENIFLAFIEFDDAIDALAKFGSIIEAPAVRCAPCATSLRSI